MELMKRLINDEEGQGLVEYGLIIALIAVVCISAVEAVGGGINKTLESVKAKLPT